MTVASYNPSESEITVTERALKHFDRKLAEQPGKMIRLSIKKSGCTGYAYVLDYVDTAEPNDQVISASESVSIAVSPQAVEVANGTQIDYVLEGINRVLKFNNPNVVAECGCGESFTV